MLVFVSSAYCTTSNIRHAFRLLARDSLQNNMRKDVNCGFHQCILKLILKFVVNLDPDQILRPGINPTSYWKLFWSVHKLKIVYAGLHMYQG